MAVTFNSSVISAPSHLQYILWFDSQYAIRAASVPVCMKHGSQEVSRWAFKIITATGWVRELVESGSLWWKSQWNDMRWGAAVLKDYPPAGTEAQWQWSSPPKRPAGIQRWASPLGLSSSTAPSAHAGTWDSPEGTASGSLALPAPGPRGCSCLEGGMWKNELTLSFTSSFSLK